MRSSIACTRCRKSKIRCENQGVNTQCTACMTAGRDCTYPPPAGGQTSTPKRSEPTNGIRLEPEGDVKRIRSRQTEVSRKHSIKDEGINPLESPPIGPQLWREIYSIFNLHFSTELPFVHESTLFKWGAQPPEERSAETEDFLLGMLTLTARFIPELVKYHNGGNAALKDYAASEFYANALIARLHATAICKPSVERCQALLMLGVYSWGMCRGYQAWMYTGTALSMAELLGLFYETDSAASRPNLALSQEESERELKALGVRPKSVAAQQTEKEDQLRDREMRRRTMWSIFIIDKWMASGQQRRRRIKADELQIQLPCSDRDFRFGNDVKTGHLTENGIKLEGRGTLDDTHILGIYIRLVEIWSKLSVFACHDGRRAEKYPPWDKRSDFFQIEKDLDDFHSSLPSNLAYTPSKLEAHIDTKTSTTYIAIHTLYSLCRVVLHREHIPFLPLRCEKPCGPLDAPTFPKDRYTIPEGYWEESARHIFKSARDIMDIIRSVSNRGCLVESPQVGFAIWQAAFVGVYSITFEWMDTGKYMCDSTVNDPSYLDDVTFRKGATGLAIKSLREMQQKTLMARGWFKIIGNMWRYFHGVKRDVREGGHRNGNEDVAAGGLLSLRSGGTGGGLEEYKLAERELKDFGTLDEGDRYTPEDARGMHTPSRPTTGSSQLHSGLKQESNSMQGVERTPARPEGLGGWAAVNNSVSYGADSNDGYGRSGSGSLDYGLSTLAGAAQYSSSPHQSNSYYTQTRRGPTPVAGSLVSPPTTLADSPYNTNQNPADTPNMISSNGYGHHSGYGQPPQSYSADYITRAEAARWGIDVGAMTWGLDLDSIVGMGPASDGSNASACEASAPDSWGGQLNPNFLQTMTFLQPSSAHSG